MDTKTPEFDGAARIPTLITELTRANHLFPLYQCIEALPQDGKLYMYREIETLLQNESLGMDDKEWTEFQQSSKTPLKRPKLIEITFVYIDVEYGYEYDRYVFDSTKTAAQALFEWNMDLQPRKKEFNTLQKCLEFVKIDKNHTQSGLVIWCHHIEPYTTIPSYQDNQLKCK